MNLRQRIEKAVCFHEDDLTEPDMHGGQIISLGRMRSEVEALVREFAAEQLREMVAWIELPDEVGECRRCNHTVKELKSRADALEKEEK